MQTWIQIEDDVILWLYEGKRRVLFWDACAFRPSLTSSIQNNKLHKATMTFSEKELEGVGVVYLPNEIVCGEMKFTNIRIKT